MGTSLGYRLASLLPFSSMLMLAWLAYFLALLVFFSPAIPTKTGIVSE